MENKIILSASRYVESTNFGNISHRFSDKNYSLPKVNPFKSLLALQEFFLKPGLGLLPHSHEGITSILIPLSGSLAQRNLKEGHVTISEGEVQLLCYEKGNMHLEYNHDKKRNLDCLVVSLSSKNKKNCNELFKLKSERNSVQKVFDSPIINDEKEHLHMYVGNYDAQKKHFCNLHPQRKGVLLYMVYGEMTVHNQEKSHTLNKKDVFALWNKDDVYFTTSKKSKFFMFKITS